MSSSVVQSKQTITKIDNVETKLLEVNGTDQGNHQLLNIFQTDRNESESTSYKILSNSNNIKTHL
jgi:hypothetical protein